MFRIGRKFIGAAQQSVELVALKGLIFGLSVLALSSSCEEKKKPRPSAQVTPENKGPDGGPTDGGGGPGGQNPVGGGPSNVPQGDYMTPLQRPETFENRPVKESDIFYTVAHYKSAGESWFKSCASIEFDGTAKGVGCSHPGQGEDSQPEFKRRHIWGFAPEKGNQSIEIVFRTFRPEVVKCDSSEATSTNSTTQLCPGKMSVESLPERRSSSHGGALKCLKSGNAHVIFYEDQSQGEVDPVTKKRLYNNFARNSEARSVLKKADGSAAPEFTDLRRIFDAALLSEAYSGTSGASFTEKQLRGLYGIDYGDVILQIDLGTSGHKLVGFEDCK